MQDCDGLSHDSRNHRRSVLWGILLAKDIGSNDATYRPAANDQGTSDGPLRLADNIVVHVTQDRRNVGVAAAHSKEHTSIPSSGVCREARHGDAYDCCRSVEDEDCTSFAIPIRKVRRRQHPRGGGDVRRERENLRHGDGIAHVVAKNDGEEEAEAVRDDIVEEIQPGPLPELPVVQVVEDFAEIELVDHCVASITVDAEFDDVGFFGGKEGAACDELGLGRAVGKVNDEDEAHQA